LQEDVIDQERIVEMEAIQARALRDLQVKEARINALTAEIASLQTEAGSKATTMTQGLRASQAALTDAQEQIAFERQARGRLEQEALHLDALLVTAHENSQALAAGAIGSCGAVAHELSSRHEKQTQLEAELASTQGCLAGKDAAYESSLTDIDTLKARLRRLEEELDFSKEKGKVEQAELEGINVEVMKELGAQEASNRTLQDWNRSLQQERDQEAAAAMEERVKNEAVEGELDGSRHEADRLANFVSAQAKVMGLHTLELGADVEFELSRRDQLSSYLEDQLAQSHQLLEKRDAELVQYRKELERVTGGEKQWADELSLAHSQLEALSNIKALLLPYMDL